MTTRNQVIPVHEAYGCPPTPEVEGRTIDGAAFNLETVLDWGSDERSAAFTSSAMKRANLEMMRRNAIITAGNVPTSCDAGTSLAMKMESIASDDAEGELVQSTARDVLASQQS